MIHSAEEFVRLRDSSDREEYLRAAHEAAPETVWLDVISRYPDYCEWVDHNKSVPHSILELLSRHPDERVRATVARRRKARPEILAALANDVSESVRISVAGNPRTPEAVLRSLLEDSSWVVRSHAEQPRRR